MPRRRVRQARLPLVRGALPDDARRRRRPSPRGSSTTPSTSSSSSRPPPPSRPGPEPPGRDPRPRGGRAAGHHRRRPHPHPGQAVLRHGQAVRGGVPVVRPDAEARGDRRAATAGTRRRPWPNARGRGRRAASVIQRWGVVTKYTCQNCRPAAAAEAFADLQPARAAARRRWRRTARRTTARRASRRDVRARVVGGRQVGSAGRRSAMGCAFQVEVDLVRPFGLHLGRQRRVLRVGVDRRDAVGRRRRPRRPAPAFSPSAVRSGSLSITWWMTTRNSPAIEPSPGLYVISWYVPSSAISPPAVLPGLVAERHERDRAAAAPSACPRT